MSSIFVIVMNYNQRQTLNRIIFWIQLIVIVVCGFYILYEALSFEMLNHAIETSDLTITYLMGRSASQIASYTTYGNCHLLFCYQTLLICREDRALWKHIPSARQPESTCSGRVGYAGPVLTRPDPAF